MSRKQVIFSPNAEKEIKRLSKHDQRLVMGALKAFSVGDGKPQIEKIKSQPSFYRLRVGNFRIIYYPLSPERVVLLLIRDRKTAYKGLGDLGERLNTAVRRLRIAKG